MIIKCIHCNSKTPHTEEVCKVGLFYDPTAKDTTKVEAKGEWERLTNALLDIHHDTESYIETIVQYGLTHEIIESMKTYPEKDLVARFFLAYDECVK